MSRNKKQAYKTEVNKTDLMDYLVHTEGLTSYKAEALIKRVIEFITLNISSFNKIRLSGLGTLAPNYIKGRKTYIHFIGQEKEIDARLRVSFKLEENLKQLLQDRVSKYEQMFDLVISEATQTNEEEEN